MNKHEEERDDVTRCVKHGLTCARMPTLSHDQKYVYLIGCFEKRLKVKRNVWRKEEQRRAKTGDTRPVVLIRTT